jgi:hypothetical protein
MQSDGFRRKIAHTTIDQHVSQSGHQFSRHIHEMLVVPVRTLIKHSKAAQKQ